MKKISYILFALFYLVLATHVSASVHLCGGSITSISIFEHDNDDACECGKMTDNACCNDVSFECKTDDSSANSWKQISVNFTQNFNLLQVSFFQKIYTYHEVFKTKSFYIFNNKPPYNLLHLSAISLRI
ncbi:MAG: hypothetical protein K9G64_09135 [Bacteroidia bacterium]|nr:hypothetical protein [Bacteroidia bacterium]